MGVLYYGYVNHTTGVQEDQCIKGCGKERGAAVLLVVMMAPRSERFYASLRVCNYCPNPAFSFSTLACKSLWVTPSGQLGDVSGNCSARRKELRAPRTSPVLS